MLLVNQLLYVLFCTLIYYYMYFDINFTLYCMYFIYNLIWRLEYWRKLGTVQDSLAYYGEQLKSSNVATPVPYVLQVLYVTVCIWCMLCQFSERQQNISVCQQSQINTFYFNNSIWKLSQCVNNSLHQLLTLKKMLFHVNTSSNQCLIMCLILQYCDIQYCDIMIQYRRTLSVY